LNESKEGIKKPVKQDTQCTKRVIGNPYEKVNEDPWSVHF